MSGENNLFMFLNINFGFSAECLNIYISSGNEKYTCTLL